MTTYRNWKIERTIRNDTPIHIKVPCCDIDLDECPIYPNNCTPKECGKCKMENDAEKEGREDP